MTIELEFDIHEKVYHRKTGFYGKVYSIELQKYGNQVYPIYHLVAEDSEGTPIAGVLIKEHEWGLDSVSK